MRKKIIFIFLLTHSCFSLGAGCFEKTFWNQCWETDGIQICSAEFNNSEILAFQGKAIINAPLKQLVSVFYDVENYSSWQINVKEVNVVRDIVPPGKKACAVERIEHSYGKKPWLVRWAFWIPDSEFIYKASYKLSPQLDHFTLYLEDDVSEKIPEQKGYRRGTVHSCYVLDSTENAHQTRLRVEIWVDLKLNIDPSRINSNLKDWPIDLIKGLKRQIVKQHITTDNTGAEKFVDHCLTSSVAN